ncbi:MAG: hypothetical protein QXO55_06855 [Candidatus Korarchaeum sp.]
MGKLTAILLSLLLTASIYALSSLYFGKMGEIWAKERRIEVLRSEILYLRNKADQYRETVAPLVLRLFSYQKEGEEVRLLYSGTEIWRGRFAELNLTYGVENLGAVRIGREDGRVVASIIGMPYSYTLKTFYYEELAEVVQYALNNAGRLDESASRDEEELARLEAELKSFAWDPLVVPFLATPIISALAQYALLKREDPELSRRYAGLLRNPYVLLPSLAVYAAFFLIVVAFHWGMIVPLHVIAVLYGLTSVPSLISPLLFAYEMME